MQTLPVNEARMRGEIELLRSQHPETQDLYREVCILLFFRYGITPTANKLYQLVRKGSMSAPAEALAKFWETLREKSRVRIEHPDLPEALRDAAGEMIGVLWQRAQASAQESLVQLRDEARAAVVAADATVQAAAARAQVAEEALSVTTTELHAVREKLNGAQADAARAQGEVATLQRQVDADSAQRRELREAQNAAQERFTREIEQQRAAIVGIEERHDTAMKRVLLDVDRERGNSAKLQKELEQARRSLAEQAELHRQQVAEKHQQAEALRQRAGELEGIVTELRGQRDQLVRDLEGARNRIETMSTAKPSKERPRKSNSASPAKTSKSKHVR
jgi:chromosome segregation ATPase